MTDDPPQGVSVLFFQVSLAAASLSSSSGITVSLLSGNPIEIDVTQLQALSAFLATANVPAGTYDSLSLTFADPQLVILNTGDTSIASSCAVGSICELTPAIDNSATVELSSSPFPVTVSANNPLGFLVDFNLNTIIQSDLSVNLGVSNGVTVSALGSSAAPQPPPFGLLSGAVQAVNAGTSSFTLQSAWGKTFTIDVNSSTAYDDFPSSACSAPGIGCLADGQSVQVQVGGVQTDGSLLAAQVTYVQAANAETVKGVVVQYGANGVELLLHSGPPGAATVPMGSLANVTFAANTSFSIDANGFTMPQGAVFAGFENLAAGQTLQVNVVSGTLQSQGGQNGPGVWGPPPTVSFTTNNVQLEPSQLTGNIASLSDPDFIFSYLSYPVCFNVCPTYVALIQDNVETTSQTIYQGFNPDSFSGFAANDQISVNAWIIEQDNGLLDPAIAPPFLVAQTIALHP